VFLTPIRKKQNNKIQKENERGREGGKNGRARGRGRGVLRHKQNGEARSKKKEEKSGGLGLPTLFFFCNLPPPCPSSLPPDHGVRSPSHHASPPSPGRRGGKDRPHPGGRQEDSKCIAGRTQCQARPGEGLQGRARGGPARQGGGAAEQGEGGRARAAAPKRSAPRPRRVGPPGCRGRAGREGGARGGRGRPLDQGQQEEGRAGEGGACKGACRVNQVPPFRRGGSSGRGHRQGPP
jgi:hypothetical protein